MNNMRNFSMRIEENTLKQLKRECFEHEKTQQALVNRYIKEGIERDRNQTKLEVNIE